jgi:hypothetical protein
VTGGLAWPFSPLLPIPDEHPETITAIIIGASHHRGVPRLSLRFRIEVQPPDGFTQVLPGKLAVSDEIDAPFASIVISAPIGLICSTQLGPYDHRAAHRMASDVNTDFINRAQVAGR